MTPEPWQVAALTVHPMKPNSRDEWLRQQMACPCCTRGSRDPAKALCNACHLKAVRGYLDCVHPSEETA